MAIAPNNPVVEFFEETLSSCCDLARDLAKLPTIFLTSEVDVLPEKRIIELSRLFANLKPITIRQ